MSVHKFVSKNTNCTRKTVRKERRPKALVLCVLLCTIVVLSGFAQFNARAEGRFSPSVVESKVDLAGFETQLETIRQSLNIPGMSAAVVQDQQLIWAKGFGYADLENRIAATPDTPYGLASVTKPVAAVLIMQLVEEGLIDLDMPVTQYGVHLFGDIVTVRHLLTHTSEETPGTRHNYNGYRYGTLGGVIEGATGRTFASLLGESILLPLGMRDTALNPMSIWGGFSPLGIDNLQLMLGWGASYQHYPKVYSNLARPYQLDDEYEIIPGMYQLYHNPAAGMLSSVSDLAKFDIALDLGLLLGDAAKAEMHAPAYSTYKNRSDLNYGLGWHVQDFEGLRMLWHTGRWPPSTSALYLKLPEKNLTFIVLANTANLTTPFNCIGSGDVSKSTLVLAFFRHFIFPEQHGYLLPNVNWETDETELLDQLAEVKDEPARGFLERELWSFRQVYASAGRDDQVYKLSRINTRAFPQSQMRADRMFTKTVGSNSVVPPVAPASAFVWLGRGMALWFVLVFISEIWMVIHLLLKATCSWWAKLLWLCATLFLGPVSILIHRPNQPNPKWRQAWGASALVIAGYSVAWSIAIALVMSLGGNPHPLAILGLTYLLPLLVGLFLIRIPLLHQYVKTAPWRTIIRSFFAEIIVLNLGYAIYFPLTILLSDRLLSQIPHPTSLFFWAIISFVAVIAVIILAPLHYWMIRQGCGFLSGLPSGQTNRVLLPGLRVTWPALLTTFSVMVASLAATIAQLE